MISSGRLDVTVFPPASHDVYRAATIVVVCIALFACDASRSMALSSFDDVAEVAASHM